MDYASLFQQRWFQKHGSHCNRFWQNIQQNSFYSSQPTVRLLLWIFIFRSEDRLYYQPEVD